MKKPYSLFLLISTLVFAAFCCGAFYGRSFSSGPVLVREVQVQAAETSGTVSTEPSVVCAADRIDLNAATQAQLMTLPGIGEVLSRRIIDYREENGPFRTVGDLMNVEGIGEKRMESLFDLVCIGGS